MIVDFLESWELFGRAYLTGWVAAALLAVLGVYLLARDQIFLGAVMGQGAACGVAVAGALGIAAHGLHTAGAVLFALLAVVPAVRGLGSRTLGVMFALFGSMAIVAASKNPHGMEEVKQVMTSSLLGASGEELELMAVLAALVIPAAFLLRSRVLFCITDYDAAACQGARPGRTLLGLAVVWAVSAGIAIHAAGLLFAFGMLVLPGAAARRFCRSATGTMLWAPVAAVLATTIGFVLALAWDLPPAPLAVVVLGLPVAVAEVYRRS